MGRLRHLSVTMVPILDHYWHYNLTYSPRNENLKTLHQVQGLYRAMALWKQQLQLGKRWLRKSNVHIKLFRTIELTPLANRFSLAVVLIGTRLKTDSPVSMKKITPKFFEVHKKKFDFIVTNSQQVF